MFALHICKPIIYIDYMGNTNVQYMGTQCEREQEREEQEQERKQLRGWESK